MTETEKIHALKQLDLEGDPVIVAGYVHEKGVARFVDDSPLPDVDTVLQPAWVRRRAVQQAARAALEEEEEAGIVPPAVLNLPVAQRVILAQIGPSIDYAIKRRLGKGVVLALINDSSLTAANKTRLKAWLKKATA